MGESGGEGEGKGAITPKMGLAAEIALCILKLAKQKAK